MVIVNNKVMGDKGEIEVIRFVSCPNCGKKLMLLPNSFPLYDVQCTACQFRAQIKSNNTKPKNIIRGAGWEIIDKVIKSGYLVPPLVLNFKWKVHNVVKQEIRFYPFIRKANLIKYTADIKSAGRKYKMFNYNLKDLKFYLLFSK